ncbi:MAG TPA: PHB depolymerase family esterase [Actinomycetota bacterium]|nr:PHB depolymerase family esterase [Actinomycetota bacterium]
MATLLVLALMLAGCGGAARRTAPRPKAPPPSPTPATPVLAGPGCGAGARSGSTTLALMVDGVSRTVIVHVPEEYTGMAPVPLVLNLHGSNGTAAGQEVLSGMDVTANDQNFLIAYPQAALPAGQGYDWNVPGVPLYGTHQVPRSAPSDVDFLTGLVRILGGRYCIDARRVYAAGFSGGARMVSSLACESSATFAAIAAVSGLRRPFPCPTTRAVPVISFHGTADPVNPYLGHGQPSWTYSVTQAAEDWGGQDGCRMPGTRSRPMPDLSLIRYSGCSDGAMVELFTLNGEGHEWPAGPLMPRSWTNSLGPQSNAVNANDAMWAFFMAHPLPNVAAFTEAGPCGPTPGSPGAAQKIRHSTTNGPEDCAPAPTT